MTVKLMKTAADYEAYVQEEIRVAEAASKRAIASETAGKPGAAFAHLKAAIRQHNVQTTYEVMGKTDEAENRRTRSEAHAKRCRALGLKDQDGYIYKSGWGLYTGRS